MKLYQKIALTAIILIGWLIFFVTISSLVTPYLGRYFAWLGYSKDAQDCLNFLIFAISLLANFATLFVLISESIFDEKFWY